MPPAGMAPPKPQYAGHGLSSDKGSKNKVATAPAIALATSASKEPIFVFVDAESIGNQSSPHHSYSIDYPAAKSGGAIAYPG